MKTKRKISSAQGGKHWLEVGIEILSEMKGRGDSGGMTEAGVMERCAVRYGKSVHSIRKIVDATIWVNGFYPDLRKNPPEFFPLTQALQLRAIHRLDPSVGKEISTDVFEGKFSGPQLARVIDDLNRKYRPQPETGVAPSTTEIRRRNAADLEARVFSLVDELLKAEKLSSKPAVSSGNRVVPPCDFVVRFEEKPAIVGEVKNFSSKEPTSNLISLLGSCALWQNQGFSPWLFFPAEAAPRISKLQSMATECHLNPMKVFLVDDEKATPWEDQLNGN